MTENLLTGEGVVGEGGGGAKSHDSEKAWSSLNHEILSDSIAIVYYNCNVHKWFSQ
jgi:hypothetical protein